MNPTTNTIITFALLGGLGFFSYKIYKDLVRPKLGTPCRFSEGGPEGTVVYRLDSTDEEGYYCRRCNKSGCSSYKI